MGKNVTSPPIYEGLGSGRGKARDIEMMDTSGVKRMSSAGSRKRNKTNVVSSAQYVSHNQVNQSLDQDSFQSGSGNSEGMQIG